MAWHWIATEWGSPETWSFVEEDAPAPGPGEITVRVRAAGVNPADAKHVAANRGGSLPVPIGYEISGEVVAVGPDAESFPRPLTIGDEVLAFRVRGGYATEVTIPAEKAFVKPANLGHPEAANLLLAGTTAAEMLDVVAAQTGETILLHGASGAVGTAVLQLARDAGVRVIGTSSEARADVVRRFGGEPVVYGPGLADRVRDIAGAPIAAALDAAGTDEAVDVSLELVAERARIVTVAAAGRAEADGIRWIAGSQPGSARFRDAIRADLIRRAAEGALEVPIARTYPLAEAREALALVMGGHPGGKVALIP